MDLALSDLQSLICHKTQTTKQQIFSRLSENVCGKLFELKTDWEESTNYLMNGEKWLKNNGNYIIDLNYFIVKLFMNKLYFTKSEVIYDSIASKKKRKKLTSALDNPTMFDML